MGVLQNDKLFFFEIKNFRKKDRINEDTENDETKERLERENHNSLTIEDGIPHESTLWSIDDCWFFYPNHTFVNSVGAMLRPPGPGGTREENSSGTWKLDENETKLDWTKIKPYNFQVSYQIIIKSDTIIITIITDTTAAASITTRASTVRRCCSRRCRAAMKKASMPDRPIVRITGVAVITSHMVIRMQRSVMTAMRSAMTNTTTTSAKVSGVDMRTVTMAEISMVTIRTADTRYSGIS